MLEFSIGFLISSFIAGILTFLAPCTLPLLPGYLGFISGIDPGETELQKLTRKSKNKILINAISFTIGFSVIFIVFGMLAGLAGFLFAPYKIWLGRIGGVFVIMFGLFMFGVLKLDVFSGKSLRIPKWMSPGNPISSFAVGSAFSFGWTPCIGPILGSVLFLAGRSSTVFEGGLLLVAFSLGLAIPFILLALVLDKAAKYLNNIFPFLNIISKIGGLFLVFLGILLATDNFGLLIQYGYKIFDFMNYQGLLKYL